MPQRKSHDTRVKVLGQEKGLKALFHNTDRNISRLVRPFFDKVFF